MYRVLIDGAERVRARQQALNGADLYWALLGEENLCTSVVVGVTWHRETNLR